MSAVVLDSSAFLALVNSETGAKSVAAAIADSVMSAVNVAEVVSVMVRRGISREHVMMLIANSGIRVEPFDLSQAEETGALIVATAALGLSLGDRACLALALREQLEVLTTDTIWAELSLPLRISTIR